ncbi:MAG: molybdopterin-synthase adenylyltransferase MoeB [Rhodobacteraceae bacterium]|nr:molybdopterin-synthase adenylyltransferase MoeB [Paracoccaceae bacterium]
MVFVFLVIGSGVVGLRIAGASKLAQGAIVVIGLAFVLAVQMTLPADNSLRVATGGSLKSWLILIGVAGVVGLYGLGVRKLKLRATQEPIVTSDKMKDVELERYARHIVLREVGGAGQQKLRRARVLVVGAGGLGSPALMYLAAAGVGTIGVIDDDEVGLSNLQRQVLFKDDDIDKPKVFAAEVALKALNPHVDVLPYNRKLTADMAETLIGDFDLVLDGTDNFPTRAVVNRACVATKTPLISGAISQWEGQLSVFDPAHGAPCYACVFPDEPADGLAPSCAEAGVMGALPGVVGAMMAAEAIKLITGAGQVLRGEMLMYDALYSENRKITVERRADCAVCGGK